MSATVAGYTCVGFISNEWSIVALSLLTSGKSKVLSGTSNSWVGGINGANTSLGRISTAVANLELIAVGSSNIGAGNGTGFNASTSGTVEVAASESWVTW